MKTDLDFLLYPLASEGPPNCQLAADRWRSCFTKPMENNPDCSRFRCPACKRSETFICEE